MYDDVVEAWLRLCLAYNAGLVLLTVSVLGGRGLLWDFLPNAILGAAIANVCFLLGPASELLARRLGFMKTAPLRYTVFAAGFGLAMLLALVSCLLAMR